MQDRYAGDVGDFGKLGLLRWLCGVYPATRPELRLGIVWYLVPDETHNNDGKHISYLDAGSSRNERFRRCDPELYEGLARLIETKRSVSQLRALSVLPSSWVHFMDPLSYRGIARAARSNRRQMWLSEAFGATRDCDLIFIDPDNGLETASVRKLQVLGPKYAYLGDLDPFVRRGQSLVIYQHIHRTASVLEQARRRIQQLRARLDVDAVWAIRYRRGSGRLYIVVSTARHTSILRRRTDDLLASPWGKHGHFEMVETCSSRQPGGRCSPR